MSFDTSALSAVSAVVLPEVDPRQVPPAPGMIWIPGGTFRMGSDHAYPDEQPEHRAEVSGFWMDKYPVTNARFAKFVAETSHVTFAELPPSAEEYPGAL